MGQGHRHGRRHGHGGGSSRGDEERFSLDDVAPGKRCRIKRLHGKGAIRQRLLDMGFVPETEVTMVRSAPLNDPIEIRIGNTFVSIRRSEAAGIEVEDTKVDDG